MDDIHIWFQTVSGWQYQVLWRDALVGGEWTDPDAAVDGDDTLRDVTDTSSASTTARFYRLAITKP